MDAFLNWVGETGLSLWLGNVPWAISSIQSVHIMAIAVVFTSALLMDLRVLGLAGRGQSLGDLSRRFAPWIGWGLVVLLLTGLLLMVAEPTRAILNKYFQIKMLSLVMVGALTWAMTSGARREGGFWSRPELSAQAKLLAVVSLLLWAVIVTTGRWIAYTN